jgi:hypothetical protein
MKRLMMLVILVGLMLSGCASTTSAKWCKPGATEEDLISDSRYCREKVALLRTGTQQDRWDFWSRCMKTEKGWSRCTE